MIRNVLEHVAGIAVYPIISLTLFMAVFIGMIVWVVRMKRSHVQRMSHLPLESDTSHLAQEK